MGSITQDELVTELKQRGFEGFSPGDLQRYLDWGFRKIARLASWDWEQDMSSITLQPGDYRISTINPTSDIPLLRDLTRIIDVTAGSSHALAPMSEQEWTDTWLTAGLTNAGTWGTPDRYFMAWKNEIYILPPPNAARTYNLYIYKYIGEVEDGLTSLPNDWEEAVLLAAECICHYRARQPQFAQECEARLQEMAAEMLTEQNMKDPAFQERVDGPWSRVR
jgi:hypothetical protein